MWVCVHDWVNITLFRTLTSTRHIGIMNKQNTDTHICCCKLSTRMPFETTTTAIDIKSDSLMQIFVIYYVIWFPINRKRYTQMAIIIIITIIVFIMMMVMMMLWRSKCVTFHLTHSAYSECQRAGAREGNICRMCNSSANNVW